MPDQSPRPLDADVQPGNTLVLASPDAGGRRALSATSGVDPTAGDLLAVTYGESADDWLDDWSERVGRPAGELAVLGAGEFARSAASAGAAPTPLPGVGTVESLGDPTDLAAMAERVRAHLRRWRDRPRRTVLVFETVSDLLSHADARTAFDFLHVVTHQVRETDAAGAYFLDPDGADPETVRTLTGLFDAVVEPDGDGWTERAYRN